MPQRRLALLVRDGQFGRAAQLADSLRLAGTLAKQPLMPGLDRGRGYGMAAHLVLKQWTAAAANVTVRPASSGTAFACLDARDDLQTLSGEGGGDALRAMTDTVAKYLVVVAATPAIAPCLEELLLVVNDSTAGRRTFAGAALLGVADSLNRAGNDSLAQRAARWAIAMDSSRKAQVLQRTWYRPPLATSKPGEPAELTDRGEPSGKSYRAESAETAQRKPVNSRSFTDPFALAYARNQGLAMSSYVSKAPPRIT